MEKYTNIKEIVEYGLDKIPQEETIQINLKDFMYILRTLEEFMRFFHNPDHYKTIEDIKKFLGTKDSNEGFEVLSNAIQKIYRLKFPKEIEKMFEEDIFEHPLFPDYYKEN